MGISASKYHQAVTRGAALLSSSQYSLPKGSGNLTLRSTAIAVKQATFLYGPAVDGAGPPSPSGALGISYIATDSTLVDGELAQQVLVSTNDSLVAKSDSAQYDGLNTVDDYIELYNRQWEPSSAPTGVNPGSLSNFTSDLLFSMNRLAFNAYSVHRLSVKNDSLPFTVDSGVARRIANQSVDDLHAQGRLFYVDYTSLESLERTSGKYAAACDAYFYISSSSGEFLPLAIRTNVSNDLIYTPDDAPNDWLLAKIIFEASDFFFGQIRHLSSTHYVAEIVYEAAIRTLSDEHPILAMLARMMYGAFGIRPLATAILFAPGADIDQFFGYTGAAARSYANQLYFDGGAGAVQSNYFLTNLERRGLVASQFGPPLKNFPFYEDAVPIYNAAAKFLTTFVESYYDTEASIVDDPELQAWVAEANGPAHAIDFPTSIQSRSELVNLLTHIAYLVSISHHAVNTNQLITSNVLPLHPYALYQPVPTAKGVGDIVPFLPPLQQALGELNLAANFARPLLAGTNRTMVHMFDDAIMLLRMNEQTRQANEDFKAEMLARSQVVKTRSFDANGLSQGMPFVWKALDPDVMPWSLTI